MATLLVSYPAAADATFDEAYYAQTHIPLVQTTWEPFGMTGAEILFPAAGQPWAAAVLLRFVDQAAIDRALASEGTAAVMGDLPNFTTITPVIYRAAD